MINVFVPCLEHHQGSWNLALHRVGQADDSTFGNRRVGCHSCFQSARGQAVAGNVDDVVGAAHDVDVAVFVDATAVTGQVGALNRRQVRIDVAFVVTPHGCECSGRKRQADDDEAFFTRFHFVAGSVDNPHVVAGNRHGGRARFDGVFVQADGVGRNRPPGFGLPPVVEHRNVPASGLGELFGRPLVGFGVEALSGLDPRAQVAHGVLGHEFAFGVFLADDAHGGRGAVEQAHVVFVDHPEERAGIRHSDGLAFEHDGGDT